jgi:hypothetical protein
MIFVLRAKEISHSENESATPEDLAEGAPIAVLAKVFVELADALSEGIVCLDAICH